MRRFTGTALLGAAGAGALALARRRVPDDVPFCPHTAGCRVGPAYVERRGLRATGTVRGEMDDMAAYARPGFDPDAVAPAVRAFYERTADYRMRYRARWHRGFRLGAAAASRLTSRIEQLNLPAPGNPGPHRLESRFLPLRTDADPRDDPRAWIRTDPESGAAVFVALYASHVHEGTRFVNIAAPLPGCNLSTVLRPDHLGASALALGTRHPGHPGLYLVAPGGPFALPLDQRFRVWPADDGGVPGDVRRLDAAGDPAADVFARHEMWVRGAPFLTVDYAASPTA